VDHLDATQDRPRAVYALESEHEPDPPLDGPMILRDAIVRASDWK
jgi:hypothetical protein